MSAQEETLPIVDVRHQQNTGLGDRLRSGGAWVVVGRGLGVAGTATATVLVTRLLTPVDFGAFVLIQSLVAFASRFALAGLNQAAVRFIAESLGTGRPARARVAARQALSISAVATVLIVLASAIALKLGGQRLFPRTELARLAPWLLGSLVLVAWQQLVAESLRGFHEIRFASLLGGPLGGALANALFPMLFFVMTRFTAPTLLLAVQLHVTAMAVVMPFGLALLLRKSRGPDEEPFTDSAQNLHIRQILAVSLPLMVSELLTVFMAQSDIWLAGLSFAPADVGFYGVARRLMILVAIPSQLVTLTVLSSIPDLHVRGEPARLQKMLRGAATIAAIPSCLILLALALFPAPILTLLFGAKYRAAAIPLVILSLGQIVVTMTGPAREALGLTGHHGVVVAVNVVAAVVLAGGGLLAARQFGLSGLAVVAASVVAVQSLTLLAFSRSRLGISTHVLISPT